MKITVTKSDIKKANLLLRKSKLDVAERCPIACAVKRIKGRNDILVGRRAIHLGCVAPSRVYRLPEKARKFIRNYDNKNPVNPFSFHTALLRIDK